MEGFPDLLVFDLEAAPPRPGSNGNRLSARDLNHVSRSVIGVSCCLAVSRAGESTEMTTVEGDEAHVLERFDAILAKHPDHELVTFNGTHFDIPLVRIRAIVNHQFELTSIGSLQTRTHHDVMKLFPAPLSLAGCSDLLGLDVDERILTRRQKCEADVVRTCLAWLHFTALTSADRSHLLTTWRTMARELRGSAFAHLRSLFEGMR